MEENLQKGQSAGKALLLAWLAGFWDGEGCIRLSPRKPKGGNNWIVPELSVTNTHLQTMEKMSKILTELEIGHHLAEMHRLHNRLNHRKCYRIMIAGQKRTKKFLDLIIPYLITKKEQAKTCKEFVDYRLSVPINTPYGEKEEQCRILLIQMKSE